MNFDNVLNQILKKYGLNKLSMDFNIENNIINILSKIDNTKRIGIWGAGEHTQYLLRTYDFKKNNIVCIIDNNVLLKNSYKYGYPIISPGNIKDYNLDVIIVSSFSSRIQIIEEKNKLCANIEHVDLYEKLEEDGLNLIGPYYNCSFNYIKLYKIKQEYETSNSFEKRQEYIWKLICEYINIRDFYFAFKYIDEYIERKYIRYKELIEFKREINLLFESLRKKLKARKNNDISMFFLDALRAKDVYSKDSKLKYLTNLMQKSTVFTNAFSSSIFTEESIASMLTGKSVLDNQLYKRKMLSIEDSDFLVKAFSKGYKINILNADDWSYIDDERVNQKVNFQYASKMLWEFICDLAQQDKKSNISIIHFLNETHPPHICGYHTSHPSVHLAEYSGDLVKEKVNYTQSEFNNQFNESIEYIDKQLSFFMEFMSEDGIKVIFSDHGQSIENILTSMKEIGPGWREEKIHVPLIINGGKVKKAIYKKLFSMQKIGDLLQGLIDKEMLIPECKYAEIQLEGIYNKKILERFSKEGCKDYTLAFKCIRTENTKYIITSDGNERYFILPSESKNVINDVRYINDIDEIRQNIKFNFEDF